MMLVSVHKKGSIDKEKLDKKFNIAMPVIPCGLTPALQSLDKCINPRTSGSVG